MRACVERKAQITHCPGVYGRPMGEYVLAHMLSINRRLPEHAENQRRKVYKPLMQKELTGCTVAIVGAGGIGAEVARLCKAFGMRVVGTRRRAAPAPNFDAMMPADAGLEAVVDGADFVVVALPHTPATRRCVGAVLAAMKRPACRGVVDDAALFAALKDDAGIAGAVLDALLGAVAAEFLTPAVESAGSTPDITIK
ncbi:D-isomer specific 2-hydroxyacid dehydrogenase [Aureococcus anophagefferens]|nr:D-isomer specific 2-hydroxyacid dehydrogenase [Aureococcus anophagefferens]